MSTTTATQEMQDNEDKTPQPHRARSKATRKLNSLTLKWGTVKAWNLETDEAKTALQKYFDYGTSMSAMLQHDSPEQTQALLDAIDFMDEIWLDWEGKQVSREEAKAYVLNYSTAKEGK